MNEYKDEYDENYYDEFAEEVEYKAEIDAYDRIGGGGRLFELLSVAATITGDESYKIAQQNLSPEDRFLVNVDALSRKMNDDGIANISQEDINVMLMKTQDMTNLRFRNATAYILGYLASKGGTSMKHSTVIYVIKEILPSIGTEAGITPPDIIRYARYWVKFLS